MQSLEPSPPTSAPSKPRSGRCIGILPAKGGDGASCLVANLATSISQDDQQARVLVMDFSLPFGDVDLFLQHSPLVHDVSSLCHEVGRLDATLLEVMTEHVAPNLHLIGSPSSMERYLNLRSDDAVKLVRLALTQYDWVILDLGLDPIGLSLLDCIGQLLVMVTPNVPSIRRAHQLVRLWESLAYVDAKMALGLSLHCARTPIGRTDVEATLGIPVSLVLPRANEVMTASLIEGVPAITLQPRSDYAQAVRSWAAQLTGRLPTQTRRSLWQRFTNR